MEKNNSFVWGSITRTFYSSAVIDQFPYYVGDWVELKKSSEDIDEPVVQLLYFFQDPLKEPSNFAVVRRTLRSYQLKHPPKDAKSEEVFIVDQAQIIRLQSIRAKCIVTHKLNIPDLQHHISIERHYFYQSSYDISRNIVSLTPPIRINEYSPDLQKYLTSCLNFQFIEDTKNQKSNSNHEKTNSSKIKKISKINSADDSENSATELFTSNIISNKKIEQRKRGRPEKVQPTDPSSTSKKPKESSTTNNNTANEKEESIYVNSSSEEEEEEEKTSALSAFGGERKLSFNGIIYKSGKFYYYNSLWRSCIALILKFASPDTNSTDRSAIVRLFFQESCLKQEYSNWSCSVKQQELYLSDEVLITKMFNLGGKCTVRHISEIADISSFLAQKEHFYYQYHVNEDGEVSDAPNYKQLLQIKLQNYG